MKKKKICNQFLLGTEQRCRACGEMSTLPPLPLSVDDLCKTLEAFVAIHDVKGCNKKEL